MLTNPSPYLIRTRGNQLGIEIKVVHSRERKGLRYQCHAHPEECRRFQGESKVNGWNKFCSARGDYLGKGKWKKEYSTEVSARRFSSVL